MLFAHGLFDVLTNLRLHLPRPKSRADGELAAGRQRGLNLVDHFGDGFAKKGETAGAKPDIGAGVAKVYQRFAVIDDRDRAQAAEGFAEGAAVEADIEGMGCEGSWIARRRLSQW